MDNSHQALANEAVAQEIVAMIRENPQMGDRPADAAQAAFGELGRSGTPTTGREAAVVLTSVIHTLQEELSFQAGEQTLEDFAAFLQQRPLHLLREEDTPARIGEVNPEQAAAFVERNVHVDVEAPAPPAAPQENSAVRVVGRATESLQEYREAMGGAPNYPDRRPTREPDPRTFFGIPIESCRDWCRQVPLKNNWIPQWFWKAVAHGFGVSEASTETPYEDASLSLESIRNMAENRDRFAAAFQRDPDEGICLFRSATRWTAHMGDNGGPDGMIRNIDAYLELFAALYENAEADGTLETFFREALTGVCFEHRFANLQQYAQQHPLPGGEGAYLPPHNEDSTVMETLNAELLILVARLGGDSTALNWDNMRAHFLENLQGIERVGADGARITITPETIDSFRDELNTLYFFE
jgi:hypothetical protein